jgi:hypothetical protein
LHRALFDDVLRLAFGDGVTEIDHQQPSIAASNACTRCSIQMIEMPSWRNSLIVATSAVHSPSVRPPAISSRKRAQDAERSSRRRFLLAPIYMTAPSPGDRRFGKARLTAAGNY